MTSPSVDTGIPESVAPESVGGDYNLLMIRADIASGKATVRSLGALYMVAMANRHARGNLQDFADINTAIADYRCPDGSARERGMALEPVKKVAWQLYEATTALRRGIELAHAGES